MNHGDRRYIWQHPDWPAWRYDPSCLADALAGLSLLQGRLLGRLTDLGMTPRDLSSLSALTEDVLKSSEIEGERLNPASVRSSIARRLGVDIGALAPSDRRVEGVVEMVLDATLHAERPLTKTRLFGWHAALFPTGYSGLSSITVGSFRDDGLGPMQVVSGRIGRQRVHFEAPPAKRLNREMTAFLKWLNTSTADPPIFKAALGHLWFVTVHPFDDGNGRIARAIGDLLLSRADASPQRFYSLSAAIQKRRKEYYDILQSTQSGDLDVTPWLRWFMEVMTDALNSAHANLDGVLCKTRYWQRFAGMPLNARQSRVLNRLLDGFEGVLNNRKWAALGKCSSDSALRDIQDLVQRGMLLPTQGGGRSAGYVLASGMEPR